MRISDWSSDVCSSDLTALSALAIHSSPQAMDEGASTPNAPARQHAQRDGGAAPGAETPRPGAAGPGARRRLVRPAAGGSCAGGAAAAGGQACAGSGAGQRDAAAGPGGAGLGARVGG